MEADVDCFAALGQPRRPWLDPDELKARFVALSSELHPDRFRNVPADELAIATQRYAELNAAFQCVSDPKLRLQHLLELEGNAKPATIHGLPAGATELGFHVAGVCKETDAFASARDATVSPLIKVQMFERGMGFLDRINELQQQLGARRSELDRQLRDLNPAWESAPPVGSADRRAALPLALIEEIYRELGFLARWAKELQARVVRLST